MMKTIFLILVLILLSSATVYGQIDLEKKATAVKVAIAEFSDGSFNLRADTRRCLENHLDFILWQKGWEYRIVSPHGDFREVDYLQADKRGDYPYLMTVTLEPEMIPLSERNQKAKENDYYVNYPLFKKISLKITIRKDQEILFSDAIDVNAENEWLNETLSAEGPDSPEPPDNMIKRGLSLLFDELPDYSRELNLPEENIAIYLIFDARYQDEPYRPFQHRIDRAVEYASELFFRQFGIGLKVEGVKYMNFPGKNLEDMQKNHVAVMRKVQPALECLIASFYLPDDVGYFYNRGRSYHVGLSHIGKRQMITAQIPAPQPSLSDWEPFINGLLILHETGHLMGAIHVAEAASVMYAETPWISSGRFDELNRAIIERNIEDGRELRKVDSYLRMVLDVIDKSSYTRADFGMFLWEFAAVNPGFEWNDNLFDSEIRRSAAHSLEGIRRLHEGNPEKARESFYRALSLTPDQGAIHYWLAHASEGKLKREHLRKAAELGFYDAIFDLMWQE